MYLTNHGGQCCGLKHMRGFPSEPTYEVPAVLAAKQLHGAAAEMHYSYTFFGEGAPKESGINRFNRYMEFLDKHKGGGHIVEVVLVPCQKLKWDTILKEAGFKLVTTGYNCNTYSTLYVYHLVLPLMPKKEKEK